MRLDWMWDLLHIARSPEIPVDIIALSGILLPVTGILLGLVYSGMIYWFQGPLERFDFSRDLLEDLLAADGRLLLDLLVASSLVSLFSLVQAGILVAILFWLFAIVISVDAVRLVAVKGYFATMFSEKFIPRSYGPVRGFLRKLRNAGGEGWARSGAVVLVVLVYPIWVSTANGWRWTIDEKGAAVFLLGSAGFGLLQVRSLLLEAVNVRKITDARRQSENRQRAQKLEEAAIKWDREKRRLEQDVLIERLHRIEVLPEHEVPSLASKDSWTSRDLTDRPVLKGPPWVKEDGSSHLNLTTPYFMTPEETQAHVFTWTQRILVVLAKASTGVSHFSVSFFRRDEADRPPVHLAMFRANKADIVKLDEENLSPEKFVRQLPGRFLADAIA